MRSFKSKYVRDRKNAQRENEIKNKELEYEIPPGFWDLVDLAMILETEWEDSSQSVDFEIEVRCIVWSFFYFRVK